MCFVDAKQGFRYEHGAQHAHVLHEHACDRKHTVSVKMFFEDVNHHDVCCTCKVDFPCQAFGLLIGQQITTISQSKQCVSVPLDAKAFIDMNSSFFVQVSYCRKISQLCPCYVLIIHLRSVRLQNDLSAIVLACCTPLARSSRLPHPNVPISSWPWRLLWG
jgi:hypothetical protein